MHLEALKSLTYSFHYRFFSGRDRDYRSYRGPPQRLGLGKGRQRERPLRARLIHYATPSRCQRRGDILHRYSWRSGAVTKGWLRVSLRKTADSHPRNKPWYPHREYLSTDVLPVKPGEVDGVDVEVWPTNVVVSPGNKSILEVSSCDTQGAGIFEHKSEIDRPRAQLLGLNNIHFGPLYENWILLPVTPAVGQ